MGSGLILLVIVGAWLAVLVPMALRSHDAGRSTSTADKFQDAMRVLARREPAADPVPQGRVLSRTSTSKVLEPEPAPAPVRRQSPAARAALVARRRRVLAVLAALAVVTLVAGLVGPTWLLAVHALVDLLVVAYVGHCRHQTVLRAEREWRDALGQRVPARRPAPAERPAAVRATTAPAAVRAAPRPAARAAAPASVRVAAPAHVAGIPDRMPPRPAPLAAPVRGAVGEPWAPLPVPLPGYVTAPTAPRRVLDLTRPGEWSDGVAAAERELGIDDQGPELEQILDRRRAAGDW